MPVTLKRVGLIVVLSSCPIAGLLAQGNISRRTNKSAAAASRRQDAIRSMDAASHGSAKSPAVIIPPLNEGPSGTSGPPLGTTVGPLIR